MQRSQRELKKEKGPVVYTDGTVLGNNPKGDPVAAGETAGEKSGSSASPG